MVYDNTVSVTYVTSTWNCSFVSFASFTDASQIAWFMVVYSTNLSKTVVPVLVLLYGGGPGVSLTLCCFEVYSTRRSVLCLTMCHFVLVVCSRFSIAITSLGEERANLSAFHTFVRFVLVWICRFPLPLGVWEGLLFVVVALPGFFA